MKMALVKLFKIVLRMIKCYYFPVSIGKYFSQRFSEISRFLERNLMEHIELICSLEFELALP